MENVQPSALEVSIGAKQLAGSGGRSHIPLTDLLAEFWQQLFDLSLSPKALAQPGFDAFPHPGQGLFFSTQRKLAICGLQCPEFGDSFPEGIYALTQQGADLDDLGVPPLRSR